MTYVLWRILLIAEATAVTPQKFCDANVRRAFGIDAWHLQILVEVHKYLPPSDPSDSGRLKHLKQLSQAHGLRLS